MNGLVYFDTNVLLYADDLSSAQKQETAIRLISSHLQGGTAVVSLQVLQGCFAAATRKLGVAAGIAQKKVELFARARVVRLDARDVVAGIELHRLTGVPFWDALIVHAARSAGAAVLYSEDLQPGAVLAGVRVINPFAG